MKTLTYLSYRRNCIRFRLVNVHMVRAGNRKKTRDIDRSFDMTENFEGDNEEEGTRHRDTAPNMPLHAACSLGPAGRRGAAGHLDRKQLARKRLHVMAFKHCAISGLKFSPIDLELLSRGS